MSGGILVRKSGEEIRLPRQGFRVDGRRSALYPNQERAGQSLSWPESDHIHPRWNGKTIIPGSFSRDKKTRSQNIECLIPLIGRPALRKGGNGSASHPDAVHDRQEVPIHDAGESHDLASPHPQIPQFSGYGLCCLVELPVAPPSCPVFQGQSVGITGGRFG